MSETVLAIDDQPDNLALLAAQLGAQGLAVLTADDGPAGLALAASARPDLILLDMAMPGMDGFEVLERLRASRETKAIPVVILTAERRDAAMVERGLALGAAEYLTKPIRMDELGVRVKSVLKLAKAERELAQLRTDFASMLAHDMRAPLDGLRLTLGVLRRQEDPASPRWNLLDAALGAVEEVGGMVDDLLHANRLEDEGFRADLAPVSLGPLVARCAASLQPLAVARGLVLATGVPEGLPLVSADAALVKRVLDNLVGNAIKFTPAGTITVTAAPVDGAVALTVRDTGPGIADERKARIFDRYYRVDGGAAGFGLGLAFCERAAAAMGGTITVADAPGGGAAFTVTLPLV